MADARIKMCVDTVACLFMLIQGRGPWRDSRARVDSEVQQDKLNPYKYNPNIIPTIPIVSIFFSIIPYIRFRAPSLQPRPKIIEASSAHAESLHTSDCDVCKGAACDRGPEGLSKYTYNAYRSCHQLSPCTN